MSLRRLAAAAGLALVAVALQASGPYRDTLSPADGRRIKSVVVISSIGASFLFEQVRNGPFEGLGPPDSHFLEISDWRLDARAEDEARAALKTRFAVEPAFYERAAFSTWNDELLRRNTLDLNVDPAIGAYVLVLRDWRSDAIGKSVHALGGLGLYRRAGAPTGVFACYRVVVVDALTGNVLASRAALLPGGGLPWRAVDPALWPKTPNDLSPAARAALAADEDRLIDATLIPTLKAMGLAR